MEHLEEIWLNHRNKIIMVIVLLIGAVVVGGKAYHPQTNVNNDPFMTTTSKRIPTTQKQSQVKGGKAVCVDIKGAVLHPGVYRLPGGSRVNEALIAVAMKLPMPI